MPTPRDRRRPPAGRAAFAAALATALPSAALASAEPAPPLPGGQLDAVNTILALVVLLVLAYLGGHPRVRAWERRIGIAHLATSGLPFFLLGLVAALPAVRILEPATVGQLGPLLELGLGWIGFVLGFRFELRRFERQPAWLGRTALLGTVLPFLLVVVGSAALLLGAAHFSPDAFREPFFLRDALVLGTAATVTARSAPEFVEGRRGPGTRHDHLSLLVQLEELAALLGLAVLGVLFRPEGAGVPWEIPGTAWLLLSLGTGLALGLVAFLILRPPASGSQSLLLLLGTVALAAGIASQLRVSPVVICFLAGVVLTHLPGDHKARTGAILGRLERPIFLLFLVIAGTISEVGDAKTWVLMAVFVAARLTGKWLAVEMGRSVDTPLSARERRVLTFAPQGSLSIAVVVSAALLYSGGAIASIALAVIGGALLTEVLVQVLLRGGRAEGGPR